MIKLYVNNGRAIILSQEKDDDDILLEKLDPKGNVDYRNWITAGDMVLLLNYYEYQIENDLEIL